MIIEANGMKFEFPEGTSTEDIGKAIDEYFLGEAQPVEQPSAPITSGVEMGDTMPSFGGFQEQSTAPTSEPITGASGYTHPSTLTGVPTRTGKDAAQPGEIYYDADVDGMPQVPAVEQPQQEQPLSVEEAMEQQLMADLDQNVQVAPQTVQERAAQLRRENPSMSVGQARRQARKELKAVPEGYSDFDVGRLGDWLGLEVQVPEEALEGVTDYLQDKKRATPEMIAQDLMQRNPDMSFDEAMTKAKSKYRQEFVQDTIETGSLLLAPQRALVTGYTGVVPTLTEAGKQAMAKWGGLKGAIGLAGLTGAASEGGRQATEYFSEPDLPERDYSDRLIDIGVSGAKDAAFTAVAGKIGETILDTGRDVFRKVGGYARESLGDLNTLGKEASALEAQAHKEQSELVERLKQDIKDGKLSRADAEKQYIKENGDIWKNYMETPMNESGITAEDIVKALRKAEHLAENPDLMSGVKSVANQVESLQMKQRLMREILGREKGGGLLSDKTQELIGLRDPNLYGMRSEAVKKALEQASGEINKMRMSSGNSSVFNDMLDDLDKAAKKLHDGKVDEAMDLMEIFGKSIDNRRLDISRDEVIAAKSFMSDLKSLGRIKLEPSGKASSSLSPAIRSAISGVIGGQAAGVLLGGEPLSLEASLGLAAAGAAGRKLGSSISHKQIQSNLKKVTAALGGKYKMDDKAIQMISEGADIAKVIAYVVLRDQEIANEFTLDTLKKPGEFYDFLKEDARRGNERLEKLYSE